MIWKYIFNPFLKYSEKTLIVIGIVSIMLGSFCGSYFLVSFDGIFDAHLSSEITFLHSLEENLINVLVVFILLSILATILYKKSRLIDILSVSMIYRIPIYLMTVFISNPMLSSVNDKIMKDIENPANIDFSILEMTVLAGVSIVSILLLVYAIILLTNGFKTATNLKKWQNYIWFAVALIIGEIVSKMLINLF